MIKCDKVFKNGPNEIYGRQPLKKIEALQNLPQISLGPFLDILFQIILRSN